MCTVVNGVPAVSDGSTVAGVSRQVRHRQKNHASLDCSAKVLASNAEANGAHHVLSLGRDEYMLNPCHARVFIVIELCEPVQVSRVSYLLSQFIQNICVCLWVLFEHIIPLRSSPDAIPKYKLSRSKSYRTFVCVFYIFVVKRFLYTALYMSCESCIAKQSY